MAIQVYCKSCKKKVWSGFYYETLNSGNVVLIAHHDLPLIKRRGEWWGRQTGVHNKEHRFRVR
jgi:hypothetical protein